MASFTPLSLLYLKASVVDRLGYPSGDVAVVEGALDEDPETFVAQMLSTAPAIVGFSCYIWNIKMLMAVPHRGRRSIREDASPASRRSAAACERQAVHCALLRQDADRRRRVSRAGVVGVQRLVVRLRIVRAEGLAELFSFLANPSDHLVEPEAIALGGIELLAQPPNPIQTGRDLLGIWQRGHAPVSDTPGYLSLATTAELADFAAGRSAPGFTAASRSRSSYDRLRS